jgi:hypothetical protein
MQRTQWHPGTLLELSGSYWRTCTLHAGVKLGIFTLIGARHMTAASVASELGSAVRATEGLLNALAALGLLEKAGDTFANTPQSRDFLDRAAPGYIGHMILHHHNLVASWARLDEAVASGKPIRMPMSDSEDNVRRENFLLGMFNNAMGIAPRVAGLIELSDRRRLLDLGGGPGTYAIHFCLQNPRLTATVFDLPTTRPFAEQIISRFEMADRVTFAEGDYHVDPVTGEYDAVWLSHILHAEGPDGCRTIIEKALGALVPGGLIMVHDFFLEASCDAPLFPALFNLNMLLGTREGRSYTESQVTAMLADCGVKEIRRLDFSGPTESGIICGVM